MRERKEIRVLIAEDEPLVGRMVRGMLERIGCSVVGEAVDGRQAVDMAQDLRPDVILMDIEMPYLDGIEATEQIMEHRPTPVVLLTAHETPELVQRAGAAGVGAYLLKPPNTGNMERAITIARARFDDMVELRLVNNELTREIAARERAEQALGRYADEQAALYAVASAVSASLEPGILLSSTIDVVLPLLDSDAGWVTLPGPTHDDPPHVVVHRSIPTAFLEAEESLPLRDCPVYVPLLAGGEMQPEPMLCTDCPRLPPEIHDESGLHSHISVPLSAGTKVLGILNVAWRAPRPFSESDRALLTAIGRQIGLALHNAQLYQAARQVDRLRALNKLDRALAATLDPDAVVEITLRQLAAAVDAPVSVLLEIPLQADAAAMRAFSVGRGWFEKPIAGRNAARWAALLRHLQSGAGAIPFPGEELAALSGQHGLAQQWGPHGMIVPVQGDERLIAVLALGGRPAGHPFTDEDRSLAQAAAARAGQSIQNARQHQAVREAEARLRQRNEFLDDVLQSLTHPFYVINVDDYSVEMANPAAGFGDLSEKRTCYALIYHRDQPCSGSEHPCPLKIVVETKRPTTTNHLHYDQDGNAHHVEIHSYPILDRGGHVVRSLEYALDITEQVQLEERLAAIHQLGRELTLLRDEEAIVRRVLETTTDVLQFGSLGCGLVDEAAGELVFRQRTIGRVLEPFDLRLPLDGERGICVAVVRSGHALNVPDTGQDPRYVAIQEERFGGSELCVPIKAGERIVGVLNAESSKPDRFTPADEQLLQTLADRASTALENARLYHAVQERAARLSALNAIGTAAVSSLDVDAVLHQVMDLTCQALDADEGSILLTEPGTEDLVFAYTLGDDSLRGLHVAPGQGIVGWVIEHGQSVRVNDVRQDARFHDVVDAATGFQTHSLLCSPIKYRDRIIGVIEIVNKREGAFDDEDLGLLQAVSSIIATALQNARLYQETARRLAETRVLQEVIVAAASTLDFDQVLTRTIQAIRQALGIDYLVFVLPDESGEYLVAHPSLIGFAHPLKPAMRIPLEGSVTGRVYTSGQPELIDDTSRTPYYFGFAGGENIHSELAVPVRVGDRVIAILNAESVHLAAFTDDDLRTFEAIATQLGVVMENVHIYEELDVLLHERERAQAQLVQSEKMSALGRLTASIAHEIGNPLQAIQVYLDLSMEELGGHQRQERLERNLGIVDGEIERITAIVRRMRDFSRPGSAEFRPTNLRAVLESVLELADKQLQHADVTVEREWTWELPLVQANPDQLKQVFLNLLLNAIDAMPEGGTLRVRAALDQLPWQEGLRPAMRIEFGDTGAGMPPEVLERLFEPFFTTKAEGSGLGLSTSYGIVEAHGGRMSATSQVGEGTTFTLLLPVEQGE